MRAVIGLGNPGSEYDGTRHNIGFAVVDAVAHKVNVQFLPGTGEYMIAETPHALLIKPLTYMNNSGVAVTEIVNAFHLRNEDLLVIVDDFHLPLGSLRLRKKGSDGGHNGLASIIWHLNSNEFPRLRCGIASPSMPTDQKGKRDFVLSSFENEENDRVQELIDQACDVIRIAMNGSLQQAADRLSVLQS